MSANVVTSLRRPDDLLRRHVRRRPEDLTGLRHAAFRPDTLGQAEIRDVGLALRIQQDVRGLQVAVKDSAQVSIVDRPGDPRQQACRGSRVLAKSRDMCSRSPQGMSLRTR